MNTQLMFSSATPEWSTPQDLFDELDKEFHFELDVCAAAENAKCKKFYTKEDNGLEKPWMGERCWMNPPYGREISKWIKKAYFSTQERNHGFVVCLLPARTDTKWFHLYIYKKRNVEIRFLKGRLKFGDCKNSAPFPSMLVIFR